MLVCLEGRGRGDGGCDLRVNMIIYNSDDFIVPVVLKTWAQETTNLEFYSETEDKTIPTIDLGVPNTERGSKT